MSRHAVLLAAFWVCAAGSAVFFALLIGNAVRNERRHSARLARYQEARDTPGLPPEWDPCVTEHPRTPQNPKPPQQGENHG